VGYSSQHAVSARVKNVSSTTEAFLSFVMGNTLPVAMNSVPHGRVQRPEEMAVFGPGIALHKFFWLIWRSRWRDDNSEDIKILLI